MNVQSCAKTLVLAGLVFLSSTSVKAEWDFIEATDTAGHVLLLDVEGDIDTTEVELSMRGGRVEFLIREYVGNQLIDEDDFRERIDQEMISIFGSEKPDVVTIAPQINGVAFVMVLGRGGDDVIDGGMEVLGGSGDDYIVNSRYIMGGEGADHLVAGPQTRSINGNGDADHIDAANAGGPVEIDGSGGDDYIVGSKYADDIKAGLGHDDVYGGEGDDTIDGGLGDGRDWIFGEDGDDTITGGGGDDVLVGGDNDDSINGNEGL